MAKKIKYKGKYISVIKLIELEGLAKSATYARLRNNPDVDSYEELMQQASTYRINYSGKRYTHTELANEFNVDVLDLKRLAKEKGTKYMLDHKGIDAEEPFTKQDISVNDKYYEQKRLINSLSNLYSGRELREQINKRVRM